MQTPSKDGIVCDHCGTMYQQEFRYYSYDIYYYRVNRTPDSIRSTLCEKPMNSLDICDLCHSQICDLIIKHNQRQTRVARCDIKGTILSLNTTHKYCVVHQADVNVQQKSMNVNKRILDIVISQEAYVELLAKAAAIKDKVGQWSAK